MNSRAYRRPPALASVLAVVVMSACTTGTPAQPSTGSASGVNPSIGAPTPLSPATGAQVAYAQQPLNLVVLNAATTQGTATYTVEVALDASFSSKVQTKNSVPEGTGGQTIVQLDPLLPSNTYYWHVRAQAGATTGVFSSAFKFTVGAQVTLGTPIAVTPLTGAVTSPRPVLTVTNVSRTGPVAAVTYKFQIADSPTFTNVVVTSVPIAEGPTQTSFVPGVDLTIGKTFYWRASASDQSDGVTTSPSTVQSFTTSPPTTAGVLAAGTGQVLWPGVQPPGTAGQASLGSNWDIQYTVSHGGTVYLSPGLDELRVFDVLDHGMAPSAVIGWITSHGYSTTAAFYTVFNNAGTAIPVFGFNFDYMTLNNDNGWDLVFRVE